MNGHADIVESILVNVVDKNPVSKKGETPLSTAAKNEFVKIYILICQYVKDRLPLNLRTLKSK